MNSSFSYFLFYKYLLALCARHSLFLDIEVGKDCRRSKFGEENQELRFGHMKCENLLDTQAGRYTSLKGEVWTKVKI